MNNGKTAIRTTTKQTHQNVICTKQNIQFKFSP